MEKYKVIKEIGSGAFSIVLKAERISDGVTVAIKKMKQKFASWDECQHFAFFFLFIYFIFRFILRKKKKRHGTQRN